MPYPHQSPCVLLVDDEPVNLRILADTLKDDYDVAIATSGPDAIRHLSRGHIPNLILLDVMMPGMDGFTVCRKLKANADWRHIPVIFVTADTTVESEQEGFDAGAVDYIHKPFNRQSVQARVKSHLTVHGMLTRIEDTANSLESNLDPSQGADDPLLSAVFEHATEAIMLIDHQGVVISANRSFERITGLPVDSVINRDRKTLSSLLKRSEFSDHIWRQVTLHGHWRGELINRRSDGDTYPELRTFNAITGRDGKTSHYLTVFSDISVTKKNQETIDYLTWYDGLTSLPNRLLLMDRLDMTLKQCQGSDRYTAIAVFDAQRFKTVNESLGLHTGDQVLQQMGQRLEAFCHETETVARLDSDEFAFLMGWGHSSPEECATAAMQRVRKLEDHLNAPYTVQGQQIHLNMCFGLSVVPAEQRHTAVQALEMAETAHHRAKQTPSETVLFFQEQMSRESRHRFNIAQGLRRALRRDGLELNLQSQFTPGGTMVGLEVLVRWTMPGHGPVSPGEFIAIAESHGLIVPLDRWVLAQTLAMIQRDPEAFNGLRVAVNVSARHFERSDFVDHVRHCLEATGVPGQFLTLELTESIMIQELDEVVAKMEALSKLGIRLSIDDFGTGYSSLSYLRHLPIHELKIDRSFTSEIETSESGRTIVTLIHRMAQELGLETVVEGVENEQQAGFLSRLGPTILQGYLLERPRPVSDWLEREGGQARQDHA